MIVRPLNDDDQAWRVATLEQGWGGTAVARLGELVDAEHLPGFLAEQDEGPVGLLTFAERADGIEVVTIHALAEGRGVGRAIMDAAFDRATRSGAARLWLITTNSNIRAIAFYQRWGMDLVRLTRNGVAASRAVKPTIPEHGRDGIPIRHELEFERLVASS